MDLRPQRTRWAPWPHIIETLAKLGRNNPKIKIGHCGYEEMLTTFRQLSLPDLESWFGPSLTMEANVNLGYSDLVAVLNHIHIAPAPTTSEVKDVSRGKIEANLLSQAVAEFLKIGMQKSPRVVQFFNAWKNPTYGEQIALAFKNEYVALRQATPPLHPDEIFGRLEAWAGGRKLSSQLSHEVFKSSRILNEFGLLGLSAIWVRGRWN